MRDNYLLEAALKIGVDAEKVDFNSKFAGGVQEGC